MSDERPVDLAFLAEQQQQIIADQRLMLDELQVQGAITRRLDTNFGLLLDELRVVQELLARLVDRVRAIEDRGE
jgi:hypothetical protein